MTHSRIINPILQSETDGIDVDSSANVYIGHNFIQCGDDGVSLKSGSDWCGRQWATPTVNVTVEFNHFNFTGGQLAFGSDMSGGVRDVLVQHNVLVGNFPTTELLHLLNVNVMNAEFPPDFLDFRRKDRNYGGIRRCASSATSIQLGSTRHRAEDRPRTRGRDRERQKSEK